MKTVQVAIQDPEYADSIYNLLSQDTCRQVRVVGMPDVTLAGVMIVDAENPDWLAMLPKEQERLIVLVHKDRDDLSKIWDAGVRHVVFHGDPLRTARTAVLGLELGLGSSPYAH